MSFLVLAVFFISFLDLTAGGSIFGQCANGFHYCGETCPFNNQQACEEAQVFCGDGATQQCFDYITAYCSGQGSTDPGCCEGFLCHIPEECRPASETCKIGCANGYSCGDGTCRNSLYEPCNSGPCQGSYYCGGGVCSRDPLHCQPAWTPLNTPCPNGYHFCNIECPFDDEQFCEQLGPVCAEVITQACHDQIAAYCGTHPDDSGCCDGAACPIDLQSCFPAEQPCGPKSYCPGGYDCGGTCKTTLYDLCPLESACPGGYFCGVAGCSNDPINCENGNPGNDELCPKGTHFCGDFCPFQDFNFCLSLIETCQSDPETCFNAIFHYCSNTNPTDPACCDGFLCDPESLFCSSQDSPCSVGPCAGKYFCGTSFDGTVCRANLYDQCPGGMTYCDTFYQCSSGKCSSDPLDCNGATPPPPNGVCPVGSHWCDEACPFPDQQFCFYLGQVCFDPKNFDCVNALNNYCAENPHLDVCCNGTFCGRHFEKCAPGNTPCGAGANCEGGFDCGHGTCREYLYETCPPNSACPGAYYCGNGKCAQDPLDCTFTTIPYGPCPNGMHYCGEGCPFANMTACEALLPVCMNEENMEACISGVIKYCTEHPEDPGCCDGFVCEDKLVHCAPQDQPCPPTSECPNGYNCGNGRCRNSLYEKCGEFSWCPNSFYCGNGVCSDDPLQCQPPIYNPPTQNICPNGQHYCGISACAFQDQEACVTYNDKCFSGNYEFWECENYIYEYCSNHQQDPACCGQQLCPRYKCAPANTPCPQGTDCPEKYWCGPGKCRDDYTKPCTNDGRCRRGFYCNEYMCTGDPAQCDPPAWQDGICSNGEHYCDIPCPFDNPLLCQAIMGDCLGFMDECLPLLNTYCNEVNPDDKGCCDGQVCSNIDFNVCFASTQPCGPNTVCAGKFDCGNGVCKDKLEDPCPTGSTCPFNYYCGPWRCSMDPKSCGSPRYPRPTGLCPPGTHVCPTFDGCPAVISADLCQQIEESCGSEGEDGFFQCLQLVSSICENPDYSAICCNGYPCPQLFQPYECVQGDQPCGQFSDCPDQYSCGPDAPCRDSLNDPCQSGPCEGKFFCNWDVCSYDPLQCQPPRYEPLRNGTCANGYHFCGEFGCPFQNRTFCNALGSVCYVDENQQINSECLDAIADYCQDVNPNDVGCCKGNKPVRCLPRGNCVASEDDCEHDPACVPGNEPCPANSACGDRYFCGNRVCRRTLEESCPTGSKCPGQYYCGDNICSDDPLQCSPPVGLPRPTCLNGGIQCEANEVCDVFDDIPMCVCQNGFERGLDGVCKQPQQGGGINQGCLAGTVNACPQNMVCEQRGETGVCVCGREFVYNPRTDQCDPKLPPVVPPQNRVSQCQIVGDPHFSTFTSQWYDFQTKCDYVGFKSGNIEIHVRHGECGSFWDPVNFWPNPTVACLRGVALKIGSDKVELGEDNRLYVNGVDTSVPYSSGGATITRTCPFDPNCNWCGPCFKVEYPNSFVLEYNLMYATISVGNFYFNNTYGLCGFWNDLTPGYVIRDGTDLGNQPNPPTQFAEDWAVEPADTLFRYPNPDCIVKRSEEPLQKKQNFGCANNAQLQLAFLSCNPIINPPPKYEDCFKFLDTSRYFLSCMFDFCEVGDQVPDIANFMIDSFKSKCSFEEQVFIPTKTTATSESTTAPTTSSATKSDDTSDDDTETDEVTKETSDDTKATETKTTETKTTETKTSETPKTTDEIDSGNFVSASALVIFALLALCC